MFLLLSNDRIPIVSPSYANSIAIAHEFIQFQVSLSERSSQSPLLVI